MRMSKLNELKESINLQLGIFQRHHIAVPLVLFLSYFLFSYILCGFFQPTTATIIADICLILFGQFFICDTNVQIRHTNRILFYIVCISSFSFNGWYTSHVTDNTLKVYTSGMSSMNTLSYLLLTIILAPLAEEILFRGIIYGHMKSVMKPWLALLLSSFIFGIMHGTGLHAIIGSFFALFLGLSYECSGSCRHSALYHSLYNALSICISAFDFNFNIPLWFIIILMIFSLIWIAYDWFVIFKLKSNPERRKKSTGFISI